MRISLKVLQLMTIGHVREGVFFTARFTLYKARWVLQRDDYDKRSFPWIGGEDKS